MPAGSVLVSGRRLGLTLVLSIAALLRFYALPSRGLIYWDEGKFALEGIRMESGLRALFGAHVDLLAGKAVGTAKPTHALLIALAYGLFGIHDYSPLLLDAAAGVVSVALTYLLARRLFGVAEGLVAALFLATSEYDVIYSRSALSENDASVFLLAAAWLWVARGTEFNRQPQRIAPNARWLFPAGLLAGIGFTANYRLLIYIAAVVALDLVWSLKDVGFRAAAVRAAWWMLGLATAPVMWQVISVVSRDGGGLYFLGEIDRTPMTYLGEVIYQVHQGKQAVLHFNPRLYLEWWVVRQGWPASLLLAAGLAIALMRRSFVWLMPASLVVLPYIVYVFAPFVVPRNLAAALPFASIVSAAALLEAARLGGRRAWLLAGAAALLLGLLGSLMSWRLTAERSGFALAARYVEQHGGGRALTSSEIMVFYLRGSGRYCLAPPFPYQISNLRAYIRSGYHLGVLDPHNSSHLADLVRVREPQVIQYRTLGSLHMGESLISSENSNAPRANAPIEYVHIHRLDPSRLPPSRIGRAKPCSRDKVT